MESNMWTAFRYILGVLRMLMLHAGYSESGES